MIERSVLGGLYTAYCQITLTTCYYYYYYYYDDDDDDDEDDICPE